MNKITRNGNEKSRDFTLKLIEEGIISRGATVQDVSVIKSYTRVGTLIVATIYLQLIQNRYMFRSFTVLQCSHQHCVQPLPAMWKS